MKKIQSVFVLICSITCFAQKLNFRKAILKSDIIIVSSNYTNETIRINDFTTTSFIKINKIDIVLKNNLPQTPQNFVLKKFSDNEDFYSDLITNGGGCAMMGREITHGKKYYDVFFIKKNGKQFESFLTLNDLESSKYESVVKQIKSIPKVENLKNETERFGKTLDWFIENGFAPDYDFIEYYSQKGIFSDTIKYSDQQYKNALQQFLNGNEELLSIVKEKHFDEVKTYYFQKMKSLLEKQELEYKDYSVFYDYITNLTNYFNEDYSSGNYILVNSLTSDKFDKYEKKNIMRYLLKVVTDWK